MSHTPVQLVQCKECNRTLHSHLQRLPAKTEETLETDLGLLRPRQPQTPLGESPTAEQEA